MGESQCFQCSGLSRFSGRLHHHRGVSEEGHHLLPGRRLHEREAHAKGLDQPLRRFQDGPVEVRRLSLALVVQPRLKRWPSEHRRLPQRQGKPRLEFPRERRLCRTRDLQARLGITRRKYCSRPNHLHMSLRFRTAMLHREEAFGASRDLEHPTLRSASPSAQAGSESHPQLQGFFRGTQFNLGEVERFRRSTPWPSRLHRGWHRAHASKDKRWIDQCGKDSL